MGKLLRIWVVIALCVSLPALGGTQGSADPTLEETRLLLQKGLNLAELDQEIVRLSGQESRLEEQIIATEGMIASNIEQVAETREHAGKILRAYYMGERVSIWTLLLSSRSMSDAIAIYEYFNMIVENDHRILNSYSESFQSLTQAKAALEAEQKALAEVKEAFLAEREKALAMEQEIEEALAASAHAEALRAELEQFTTEWKETGVPLLRKYLSSISEAMQSLPELLTGSNADKYIKDMNLAKRTMRFEISDEDLTSFFRSKNSLFENLSFRFEDNSFQAFGIENQVEISIKGRYVVENTAGNKLQFYVDQLTYKGFVLPDSSNRALEQEFDLGFQPSRYMNGIEATEVTMEEGLLSLGFKLNL